MTDSSSKPRGLRVIFAGTPDFAAASLNALISSQHTVCAVFTQPDRKAGRGRKLNSSPVKILAEKNAIPIFQPNSLKLEDSQQPLRALKADIMVVAAYGLLLPATVLTIPPLGCVNIHASLLPRWRGAAPIQRAILAGDELSGITFMQMDEGLDTGTMLKKVECSIAPDETGGSLHDKLAKLGAEHLGKLLDDLKAGKVIAEPQDETQACYAKKLSKEEALINWHDDAAKLERMIRAFNPWPVAFTTLASNGSENGSEAQTLRIWNAHLTNKTSTSQDAIATENRPGTIIDSSKKGIVVTTGKGLLTLSHLQLPGSKTLSAEQLLNAKHELFKPGQVLG